MNLQDLELEVENLRRILALHFEEYRRRALSNNARKARGIGCAIKSQWEARTTVDHSPVDKTHDEKRGTIVIETGSDEIVLDRPPDASTDGEQTEARQRGKIPVQKGRMKLPLEGEMPLVRTWVKLKANKPCEDKTELTSIPYFGDNDEVGVNLSVYDLKDIITKEAASVDLAKEEFANFYALSACVKCPDVAPRRYLRRIFGDTLATGSNVSTSEVIQRAESSIASGERVTGAEVLLSRLPGDGARFECEGLDETLERWCPGQPQRQSAVADPRDHSTIDSAEQSTTAFNSREGKGQSRRRSRFSWSPEEVPLRWRSPRRYTGLLQHHPDNPKTKGASNSSPLEAYSTLFCRRCYTFDCGTHGSHHPKPHYSREVSLLRNVQTNLNRRLDKGMPFEVASTEGLWQDPSFLEALRLAKLRIRRRLGEEQSSTSRDGGSKDWWVFSVDDGLDRQMKKAAERIWSQADSDSQSHENALQGSGRGAEGTPTRHADAEDSPPEKKRKLDEDPTARLCQLYPPRSATQADQALISKGADIFDGDSAVLRRAFPYIKEEELSEILSSTHEERVPSEESGSSATKGKSMKNQRSKRSSRSGLSRDRPNKKKDVWHGNTKEFFACSHDGPCSLENGCPCTEQRHKCSKFCSCGPLCSNAFRGCRCRKGACSSASCPCYASHRECDPDLCGCDIADDIANAPEKCRNASLRYKLHRRLLLGESGVHGWGVFVKDDVEKGEYIHEYIGELVSQEEADRRGQIYDKVNHSFLFDLNETSVLDAARQGNKCRFANHSDKPNCYARIMTVSHDHRIAIFAKRKIRAGEELFYDYMHEVRDVVPQWLRESAEKDGGRGAQLPRPGR